MAGLHTPVLVLGLGSVLMGDDAVGPTVIHRLNTLYELPEEVELLDAGTPGPELVEQFLGRRSVIVVDTVRLPDHPAPGSVHVLDCEVLLATATTPRLSPHDPGLGAAILTAEWIAEKSKDVSLVGIVPERIELGTQLSSAVAAALPEAIEAVLSLLRDRKIEPLSRGASASSPPWWQSARAQA